MDAIAATTVCHIVEKARAFDSRPDAEDEDPASDIVDDDGRETLEVYPDDPTEEELRELIDGLDVDARAELVALAWLGRGDFAAEQWPDALAQARDRANERTADYLLGMPLLGDYLEEGLNALGYDCADVEEGRA